jgi:hypothetical protein
MIEDANAITAKKSQCSRLSALFHGGSRHRHARLQCAALAILLKQTSPGSFMGLSPADKKIRNI